MAKAKSNNGRKPAAAARKRKQTRYKVIRDNVILIGIGVLSILLFLSLLGFCGRFGIFAGQIQFGLFGVCAYAFPFLLIGLAIYIYTRRRKKNTAFAAVMIVLLYLFVCLMLQLLTGNYTAGDGIFPVMSYSISHHLGGGFFGGGLELVLRDLLGLIGTWLIDIAGIILCIVALTGKSFVEAVGNRTNKAYQSSKEVIAHQKENIEQKRTERREEREKKRMDHVVTGVSLDMTVEESTQKPSLLDVPVYDHTDDPAEERKNAASPDPGTPSDDLPQDEPEPEDDVYGDTAADAYNDPDAFREDPPADAPVRTAMTQAEIAAETAAVAASAAKDNASAAPAPKPYSYPPLSLLHRGTGSGGNNDKSAQQNRKKLQDTLSSFGVDVQVTGYEQGPTVTRYELLPAAGVKVSRILALTDDIKLSLAAADVRIEAPIPGKSAIGIEVPNQNRVTVPLRDLLETRAFQEHPSRIVFAAGKDISGNVILADIQKMPHLLIAGATGSGKSVCINTIVMSILYHADPAQVKLIMIDPKVVELSVYNGIPHLFTPVVTDPKKAAGALNWAVQEMTRRYQVFSEEKVRDITAYNEKARRSNEAKEVFMEVMPQIVIIVDELADLMMVAPNEVEDSICRLAQLARAAGLHLVIATQRPSVNVITGLIKANMPSRIAFSVSSGVDSRTILDMNGAEKLLGNGDMLYYPQGYSKPRRVQGAFVTDEEVSAVVNYLKSHNDEVAYHEGVADREITGSGAGSDAAGGRGEERDPLYEQAGRFLIESEKGSIGSLQRKFRIGFNRAARIVDQLTEDGVLGPEEGTKPRQILMTMAEFELSVHGEGQDTDADY